MRPLPRRRTTLFAGRAGSATNVFAVQFLVRGITDFDQSSVFVTFAETPDDIRANLDNLAVDDVPFSLRSIGSSSRYPQKALEDQLGADADDDITRVVEGAGWMQTLVTSLESYSRIRLS